MLDSLHLQWTKCACGDPELMKGRTWRKRRAKTVRTILRSKDFVLAEEYIDLLRWAKSNGARFPKLHPASFSDTGRGIVAKKGLTKGEEIISLPESLLITCQTVKQGWFGSCLEGSGISLTPRQKLCVFLIYERCRGEDSFWRYYIASLPQSFNTPACFTRAELGFLPESCRLKAEQQIHEVKSAYKGAKAFWSHLLMCTGHQQNLQGIRNECFQEISTSHPQGGWKNGLDAIRCIFSCTLILLTTGLSG